MITLLLIACTADTHDTATAQAPEAPWPDWAFHHWVWEDESTQDSALALVDGYLERDIDVGAIIIDSPWETGYNTFEWDLERFPDPAGMIDELHDKGVRVFLWIVPGINTDVEGLYETAAANDWFMKGDADDTEPEVVSWWKGEGSLIDYWNEDAVAWWHGLMQPVLDLGIDGWKCDGLDFSALLAPYSPAAGREVERLEYSHAYYRDFHDHTREVLGDDRILTARPIDNYGADLGGDVVAFAPIDITWSGWVGDQDATFDGLQAALRNFYWSAEYGYVAFGSDIGGYRDEDDPPQGRTSELLLRWTQLGAFSPVMENGGGGLHHPWAWEDPEVTDVYRDFVELHYALLPYLNAQGAVAFDEGRSLMRFVTKPDYTYLLGEDLFIAPMIEEGTERTVAFPSGDDWIYLFDRSQSWSGGATETLQIPLDEYPAFIRAGSDLEGADLGR